MYSVGQVREGLARGIDNPAFFAREVNRQYYRRLGTRDYNRDGVAVMHEDWDTLLLLDACRYDAFRSRHQLPGRLEARTSRGSHTVEFLRGNFADGHFGDTVYVTASPLLYQERRALNASFHAVVNVWRDDGWNDEHGTVLPETTTEYALEACDRFPNKRLIVHYLQPHYPFIGSGADLNTRLFGRSEDAIDVWEGLMRGSIDVPRERIWRAYERNLDLVLDSVDSLLSALDGRTVVSADHGNMIGERAAPIPIREWGHPPGLYTDQLVTVPWLVYDSGPRRRIVTGGAAPDADDVSGDVVDGRLRDLGYLDM